MRTLCCLIALPLLLITFCVPTFGQYESQGYLPLTKAELRNRFPVSYVGTMGSSRPGYFENKVDTPLGNQLNIGPSGATITTTSEDDVVIAGNDKLKKPWSIQVGSFGFAYECRFYVTDLDRNGLKDAVLVFPTGGNGLAPTSHILTITFEENGRPVTFEADGYFQDTESGIFDLVDLNKNGRAELIYMNFSDGYWITNIYEVRNARWQKVVGQHANRRYPLYTRFTIKENHKPTVPRRDRHPFAPDLSNRSPHLVGQLVSYQWAKVSSSEDISLSVKDQSGRIVSSTPVSWYSSFAVVMDSSEGRKIVSLSANEETVKSLLDKIVDSQSEVALFGQRRRNVSSPEILWAKPTP